MGQTWSALRPMDHTNDRRSDAGEPAEKEAARQDQRRLVLKPAATMSLNISKNQRRNGCQCRTRGRRRGSVQFGRDVWAMRIEPFVDVTGPRRFDVGTVAISTPRLAPPDLIHSPIQRRPPSRSGRRYAAPATYRSRCFGKRDTCPTRLRRPFRDCGLSRWQARCGPPNATESNCLW